ncbi:hypothetical protein [Pajaroellobacter abortibovis]|uniref:hypothetical protein n=1 Tax=Pajaroellobacter abortibovis TaxID=1882918 RepID=UPI0012EB6F65|nr:hypothetical protein [Pajaroellobacter abortibovis]
MTSSALPVSLAATPPDGFFPFNAPGEIVRVSKAGCLMQNQIYPKPEDAERMVCTYVS